jgi:hypothetical protein
MESGTTTTTEVTVEHQKEEPGSVEDFNAAQQTHYVTEDDKVRVEYIETTGENIVQIVDFGNNFSTAIVSTCDQTAEGDDQGNGIVTVISESQLQESGITYEYIPIQTLTGHNQDDQGQPRVVTQDALQAALESAEVDKMDILRSDGSVIYENSDSNSQQNQVLK